MALLVVCVMVASVVYFLIAGQNLSSHELNSNKKSANSNEPNAINFLNNYSSINRNQKPNETNRRNETQTPALKVLPSNNAKQNIRVDNFSIRLSPSLPPQAPVSSSSPSSVFVSSTTAKTISAQTPQVKKILLTASTTRPTLENNVRETSTVKNVKVYTNPNSRRKLPQPAPKHTTLLLPTADDLEENVVERSKLLFPSKETLESFGFTSGHSNSFGVPIEEDERVLRILNYQMISSQPKEPKQKPRDDFFLLSITTDANVLQTKVSPTLPNIKKNFAPTERIRALNVTTDDGNLHFFFY